ncbi:MAG TPA: hypothetical protein VM427_00680 [Patescibacteria group bacterium]|nr:hypothetical protein [Patescibacteria group bacterium]
MSGTTRTVQQPLDTRNFLAVLAIAAIVLAGTVAIAWSSTNLANATPAAAPGPAPLSPPMIRDLGSRDLGWTPAEGLAINPVRDLGSRDNGGAAGIASGFAAPGAFRGDVRPTSGSSATLVEDETIPGSSQGAPAARHAGLRAQ